jgi:hypothetical protein
MLKEFLMVVILLLLFISIIIIYNARGIVRKKSKIENENTLVIGMKVVGYFFSIACLITLYFLNR